MSTVLLCADHQVSVDGFAPLDAVAVEQLCIDPGNIAPHVPDEETDLVLAVHREDADLGQLQAAVRRLGFDPLAVGLVYLEAVGDDTELARTLAGAVARVASLAVSQPEQVKLLPPDRSTRRGFLFLGSPTYFGAPGVDAEACVAHDGCRACVASCPVAALSWNGAGIGVDLQTCVACGTCVTTCPTGAVSNPSIRPEALEAEMKAIIGAAAEPVRFRYRCRTATVAAESGWYQIEVPCTGMLTVGWLLAPLLLGAAEVDAIDCEAGGCPLARNGALAAAVRDAEAVADALALDPEAGSAAADGSSVAQGWFGHRSTARVIDHLVKQGLTGAFRFDSGDVGSIAIDPASCTACEMCARICPTDALQSEPGVGVLITFDPTLCVACDQCVSVCPEIERGAITVTRGFHASNWAGGRREVRHEPTPQCELCGAPVAPRAMLARINDILGDGSTTSLIARRCIRCRGR